MANGTQYGPDAFRELLKNIREDVKEHDKLLRELHTEIAVLKTKMLFIGSGAAVLASLASNWLLKMMGGPR